MRAKQNSNAIIPDATHTKNTGIEKPKKTIPINEIKRTTPEKPKHNDNPALIIKPGATDLRRGPKALAELATHAMREELAKGNMPAFTNKPQTKVKIIRQTPDGLVQYLKHFTKPIPWPSYEENGIPRPPLRLTGRERDEFLASLQMFIFITQIT